MGGDAGTAEPDAEAPADNEPGCTSFDAPTEIAELEAQELTQLSGLVASRRQPGIFYAHLDAGAAAELYVFDDRGTDLGRIVLSDLETRDWEDITVTPELAGSSTLFIGDIGDNAARMGGTPRSELQIYRLSEPDAPSAGEELETEAWGRITVAYPAEAHDAETLMYDPIDELLVIVTKEASGISKVFTVPANVGGDETVVLEEIAEVVIGSGGQGAQASAGDISPSGDRILVRNYESALLWARAPSETLAAAFARDPVVLQTASEPQSEGISFAFDGEAWYSAGEQELAFYRAFAACE